MTITKDWIPQDNDNFFNKQRAYVDRVNSDNSGDTIPNS